MLENETEVEEMTEHTSEMEDVFSLAQRRFNMAYGAVEDEREQSLEDRRFYSISGAQWEGAWGEQWENKPKLEVNKVHLSVIRIINEYRANRIAVDFVPDGPEADDLSDTCDALFRADEQDSNAREAYDNGYEEAVGGGIGAWRLRADYEDHEDDENEYQRIKIEPIYDADSTVFWDPNAKRADKADASYCFVLTPYDKDVYEEEYEAISTWPKNIESTEFDWAQENTVYVAEYYICREISDVVRFFRLEGTEDEKSYRDSDFEADDELADRLTSMGWKEVRNKKIRRKRVQKYVLSGGGIIEDCGCIAGTEIPIVMTYGKRWIVDGIERAMGHVRLAKDAQRIKNMMLSRLAEIASQSSIEKPIFTPEQVAGHEKAWENDAIDDYAFLLVNPIHQDGQSIPAGPLAYTKPPEIPTALAALLQSVDSDFSDLLGNQEAGDEIMANVSGKALEAVQQRLDMQAYIYMDNMANAVRRTGEIWLCMARELYVEEDRIMRGRDQNDDVIDIDLGERVDVEGSNIPANDMSKAKMRVHAEVGPTSSSRRQATVRALTGVMQVTQEPQEMAVLSAMVMKNLEGEGMGDVRRYAHKKLVRMGIIEPTDEEREQLAAEAQAQGPDAQEAYLLAEAQNAQAKAQKAEADTIKTIAEVEETRAKTAEILSNMSREERAQVLDIAKQIQELATGQPNINGRETGTPPGQNG